MSFLDKPKKKYEISHIVEIFHVDTLLASKKGVNKLLFIIELIEQDLST